MSLLPSNLRLWTLDSLCGGFVAGIVLCVVLGVNAEEKPVIKIELSTTTPSESVGMTEGQQFPVGYGRKGVGKSGSVFRGGVSLLGQFRVNAILSHDGSHFEMTPELIERSGKTKAWLRENLFKNMNSIDFDGDGKGGEYGEAFISLEPINSKAKQPFAFNLYRGTFRWYSYALHGTQDPDRIGKKVTGGCINVAAEDLRKLVKRVQLGDLVEIVESQ